MPGAFRARHGITVEAAARGFLAPTAAEALLRALGQAADAPRLKADRRDTVRGLLLGPEGILHDAALLLRFEEVLGGLEHIGRVPPPLPLPLARSRWRLPRSLRATLRRHGRRTLTAPPDALDPTLAHLEACAKETLTLAELDPGPSGRASHASRERLTAAARELESLLFEAMQRRPDAPADHEALLEDARILVTYFDPIQDPRLPFTTRLETARTLGELAVAGAVGELHALVVTWRATLSDLLQSAVEDAT
ncbi:MAG: hypothetical protein P1V51_20880 [Deltaproteobacteria bacterium]|nr:hypothetical protein [Deltaproteobacteria bacterium]